MNSAMQDYATRQELFEFFNWWRKEDIQAMEPGEVAAWTKHFAALRDAGFHFKQAAVAQR